jgi:hypothetical protein
MSGALSARCIAHRVLCIVLSGACFLSRVLCAAPSASRITPFALRFLPSASRIAFPASRPLHPFPPGKPIESDSKPLTRLR